MSATIESPSKSHVGKYLLSDMLKQEGISNGPKISDTSIQQKMEDAWKMINWEHVQKLISKNELDEIITTVERHQVAIQHLQHKGGGFIRKEKSMGVHRTLYVNDKGWVYINFKYDPAKRENHIGKGSCKNIKFSMIIGQSGQYAFAKSRIEFQANFIKKEILQEELIEKICKNEETYGKLLRNTPFVVHYHDVIYYTSKKGVVKQAIYMPYYNSGSLTKLHKKGLSKTSIIQIFLNVVRGLGAIHEKGLIHRDIKCANIVLHQEEGKDDLIPHIIDLGFTIESDNLLALQETVGSLGFVAPELWKMYNTLSHKARHEILATISNKVDMYSLAIIFGSALLGMKPKFDHCKHTVNDHYRYWKEPENKQSVEHLIWLMSRDDPDLRPSCKETESLLCTF